MTHIPLVDLAAQHAEVADEVRAGFDTVLAETSFIGGKAVTAFEEEYARYAGVQHCIGVGNGTDALEIALRACGVGVGSEVVLPANTFVATAEAVVRSGATVVLADVDPVTLLLDSEQADAAVTPRTRALLPVHLYGQMVDMTAIGELAERCGAILVEDAAQSQGARQRGRPAGALGLAAGTSFYPGKNLGAYGDAGAVLTNSDAVARLARSIANHGSERRYHHDVLGFNSRMDTLQAVVLKSKLARLDTWNDARRLAAQRYDELLAELPGVVLPRTAPGNEHVWHLYVIQVPARDAVLASLNQAGVGAAVHYPVPVHLQPAFSFLPHRRGEFPVAEAAAGRLLSLPLHPHLTVDEQVQVATALAGALR